MHTRIENSCSDHRRPKSCYPLALSTLVVLLILAGFTACRRSLQPDRYNILIVTLDTTRADRLGCYGYPLAITPTLDQLAHDGVRFKNCHSHVPLTLPSHTTLMTGLYPPGRPVAVRARPGSPADRAGIQSQDEFLAIESVPVYSRAQLIELISKRADKLTRIKLMRAGTVVELEVTPVAEPPAEVARIGVELTEQIVRPGPKPWEQFGDVLGMLRDSVYAVAHHKQTGVSVKSFAGPVGILGGWWGEFATGGMRRGCSGIGLAHEISGSR